MQQANITWFESTELTIFFSEVPHVCVRYPLPSMTDYEVEDIKKKPFINKKDLNVALFDHYRKEIYKFTIPKGYKYDGATIPRFFWRIIGSNTDNTFLIPALIHDVLCENHHYIDNDREFSTKIFDALLKAGGVNSFKRFLMTNSVDLFQRTQKWGQ